MSMVQVVMIQTSMDNPQPTTASYLAYIYILDLPNALFNSQV